MLGTVLVVCGNNANRLKTIELIKAKGFDVVGAKNAFEGMVKAKKYSPDCIYINIVNHQNEAIEAMKSFRANPQLNSVPIMLVVDYDDADTINQAIQLKVNAYIPVPEEIELIANSIGQLKSCDIGSGTRILVVEDDESILQGLAFYLRKKEYDVLISKNGKDAYVHAKTFLPDLIIMDYNLPGCNGIYSAKRIREIPYCKDIPIIGHTSFVDKNIILKSVNAGFDLVLKKPVPIDDMYAKIDLLLKNSARVNSV